MFACTKFPQNKTRGLGFRARKPRDLGHENRLKSLRERGRIQKTPQKKISHIDISYISRYISIYPFIPTNPLLAAIRIFSFFFQTIVRSSPIRHAKEK